MRITWPQQHSTHRRPDVRQLPCRLRWLALLLDLEAVDAMYQLIALRF